jgi:hypothetical protein
MDGDARLAAVRVKSREPTTSLYRARRYMKLGFGGAHTESNQRLMYTSAWASPQ